MTYLAVLVVIGWLNVMGGDWSCVGADPTRSCGASPATAHLVPGQDRTSRATRFGVDFSGIRSKPSAEVAACMARAEFTDALGGLLAQSDCEAAAYAPR